MATWRPYLFVEVRITIRAHKYPTQPFADLKDVMRSNWGTGVSREPEPMSSSVLETSTAADTLIHYKEVAGTRHKAI